MVKFSCTTQGSFSASFIPYCFPFLRECLMGIIQNVYVHFTPAFRGDLPTIQIYTHNSHLTWGYTSPLMRICSRFNYLPHKSGNDANSAEITLPVNYTLLFPALRRDKPACLRPTPNTFSCVNEEILGIALL